MRARYLRCTLLVTFSLAAVCALRQPDWRHQEPPSFRQLACHDAVHCVAFSPDGKTLAAGSGVSSRTGEIKLWDLTNPQEPWTLSGHQSWIVALAFAPDSLTLGTASFDAVRRWDLATQQPVGWQHEDFGASRCGCLAFRPDLKQLALAALVLAGPTLRLGSIPPSAAPPRLLACPESITALAYAADGQLLAAAGAKGGVRIHDTCTGAQRLVVPAEGSISALAFTPDGQGLALGDFQGCVQLWDLAATQARVTWVGDTHAIYCLAFSPDGRLLATGGHSGAVKLWDPRTGTELAHSHEHADAVTAVRFSPDGQWLASGSFDTTLGLWRLAGPLHQSVSWVCPVDKEALRAGPGASRWCQGENDVTILQPRQPMTRPREGIDHWAQCSLAPMGDRYGAPTCPASKYRGNERIRTERSCSRAGQAAGLHIPSRDDVIGRTGTPSSQDLPRMSRLRKVLASVRRPRVLLLWGPVLLAGACLGTYYAGRELWARQQYQLAQEAFAAGDLASSRTHLLACLQVWPGSADTHFLTARTLRRLEEYDAAEQQLRDCEGEDRFREAVRLERALAQAQDGDLPGVESYLVAAVQRHHEDTPLIAEALTKGYARSARLAAGLHFANLWVESRPGDSEAWSWRGSIEERLLRPGPAVEDLRRAVQLNAADDRARQRLARLLLDRGQLPEARTHYQYLTEAHPEDRLARLGLTRCPSGLGRLAEAQTLLDGLLAEGVEDGAVLLERGKVALDAGRVAEAEPFVRRAVRVLPFDHRANYLMGQCLQQAGKNEEAQRYREQAARIEADVKRLRTLMRKPLDAPQDLELRYEIGLLLLRNEQVEDGIKWLRGILQVDPGHRPTHRALAEHYRHVGEQELASHHGQRAGTDQP
jgi:tetratricopeptide (TPR) repeat protein